MKCSDLAAWNELDDSQRCLDILEAEREGLEEITTVAKDFITRISGNDQWERIVAARQLRKKQAMRKTDYDPVDVQLLLEEAGCEDPFGVLEGDLLSPTAAPKPSLTQQVLA